MATPEPVPELNHLKATPFFVIATDFDHTKKHIIANRVLSPNQFIEEMTSILWKTHVYKTAVIDETAYNDMIGLRYPTKVTQAHIWPTHYKVSYQSAVNPRYLDWDNLADMITDQIKPISVISLKLTTAPLTATVTYSDNAVDTIPLTGDDNG